MKCYVHDETRAVGVCKVCGKGVCHVCGTEGPEMLGITCSEACRNELSELREMNTRGKKVYGIGVPKKFSTIVWICLIFGVLFGGFSIFQYFKKGYVDWFLVLFAGACFFLSVFSWLRSRNTGFQY